MKHLLLLSLLSLFPACRNCRTLPPAQGLQVYLLAGQSLMVGNWSTTISETPDARVLMFKNGSWQTAVEPINEDVHAFYGPGVAFGKEMVRLNPSTPIGLVSCAVGSTTIDEWQPGSCSNANFPVCGLFERCDAMIRAAMAQQPGSTFAGILVNQGQSDMHEGSGYWPTGFANLVESWRTIYGGIPIVFAQLGIFVDPLRSQVEVEQFKAGQAGIKKSHVYMIRTDDLPVVDGVHLTTEGQIIQGQRFAQTFQQAAGIEECTEPWWSRIFRP